MSILTSLIPEPYGTLIKIGAVIAIVGGAFGYGYMKGIAKEKVVVQTQVIKEQGQTITVLKTQTVIDTSAVSKLQQTVDQLQARNNDLQTQVKNLPISQCTPSGNLSPDWVRDYNSSVQASAPATTSQSDGAAPATSTVASKR